MHTDQITLATDGQIAQVKDVVGAALRKSGLGKDGVQRVIAKGDILRRKLIPILRELGGADENPYADEQTEIGYHYPDGWTCPGITEQVERLMVAFPDLKFTDAEIKASQVAIPEGADGVMIIPKLSALGRIFGIADPYGSGYGQLVEKVLDAIANTRKLYNYRSGELDENYIRLHADVKSLLEELESADEADFLVLPINFGDWKTGFCYSPRNARWQALNINQQLPLGSAQIGCMLIADPSRLVSYENLFIDCPADEYNWGADGRWADCPYFYFGGGEVKFRADGAGCAGGRYCSAAAFLGV